MRSGIAGTFIVDRAIFERWGAYDGLRADINEACTILSLRTGLEFKIKEDQLAAAHTSWQQDMALWIRDLLPPGTKDLSHLKKVSILLAKLCEFGCIEVSGEGFSDALPQQRSFLQSELLPTPNRMKDRDIRKFRDGGGPYFGWLLAYHVCEFFEKRRRDKLDPYETRITAEFEIDMVSGLLSSKLSAQGIHLVLKALFLRD